MMRSSCPTPLQEERTEDFLVPRRIVLCLLFALPLAACGRKGAPEEPEDADPKAPRRYPVR